MKFGPCSRCGIFNPFSVRPMIVPMIGIGGSNFCPKCGMDLRIPCPSCSGRGEQPSGFCPECGRQQYSVCSRCGGSKEVVSSFHVCSPRIF